MPILFGSRGGGPPRLRAFGDKSKGQTVAEAEGATSRGFNRYLLFCTALVWLCYLLALVPLRTDSEIVLGLLKGFFVLALVWSPITTALALYGALRYRYRSYFITALLATPLVLLCWYHACYWSVPGNGRVSNTLKTQF